MRIKDEAMFMMKSGGTNPVMDGLYIWVDGQDPLVTCSTESISFLERVSGTALELSRPDFFGRQDWYQLINDSNFIKITPVYLWAGSATGYLNSPYGESNPKTVEFSGFTKKFMIRIFTNSGIEGGFEITNTTWRRGYNKASVGWYIISGEFPEGTSHHYAVVIDGQNSKTYVDGVLVDIGMVGSFYPADVPLLQINATYGTYDGIGIGSIRCYNKPLTETEILQNYNYEKSLGRVE